jgi:hypothetical protein
LATPQSDFVSEVDLAVVDQRGGSVRTVAVNGDRALLGVGPRLLVLDVSDPAAPRQIGQSDIFPRVVADLVWRGAHAYVATNESGFWIVEMQRPATPHIKRFFATSHSVIDFKLHDEMLLALGSPILPEAQSDLPDESHLSLVDVSDPGNPRVMETIVVDGRVHSWSLVNDSVYLMSRGLDLVNIADPNHPEITHIPAIDERAIAAVAQDEVYLVGNEKIRSVDISDPANPVEIDPGTNEVFPGYGITAFEIEGQKLVWVGNFCDAGMCGSTLQIHDVGKSGFPELSHVRAGFLSADLFIQDDYAYIATEDGLNIVDLREPATASGVGRFAATGRLHQVSAAPNRVGAFNPYTYSLYFFPLPSPVQPGQPIRYAPSLDTAEIFLQDDDLFLSTGVGFVPGDLRIVDATDMQNPAIVGVYEPEDLASDFRETVVQGDYAYTILNGILSGEDHPYSDALAIIDISHRTTPRRVGLLQIESLGRQTSLAVDAEIAYVAVSNRLMAISLIDPEQPAVVGELELEGGVLRDVAVVSARVYLILDNGSTGEDQLLLIDSSRPEDMRVLNRVAVPDDLSSLAIEQPYAYLSGTQLWVADVSDSENLRLVGTSFTPGDLQQVTVRDGIIYASDGAGGLLVLRLVENLSRCHNSAAHNN